MQKTEMRNPDTMNIDRMSTGEILRIINRENMNSVMAVEKALDRIEKACDAIISGMEKGGRLFYIGAGTSGRLGIVDAAECPPTFGVSKDLVVGIIAGGHESMFAASEGAEDNYEAGAEDLGKYDIKDNDTVVGISAAGNAAYILGALDMAKEKGAETIGITCNEKSKLDKAADISIVTDTGAEVVTGSTRMKAGTAQKLVLNMLSTTAMIKTGKVYENLMINLRPSNKKLTKRMVGIVKEVLGCGEDRAKTLLDENEWNLRSILEKYHTERS